MAAAAPDGRGESMAVTAEVRDRVGWITLDRPPDNGFDAAFLEELDGCVGQVAEAEVAVAVIRSASGRFFSAGADPKVLLEQSPEENLAMCRRAHQVLGRFADESPLFLAAIAGHALGGGYEIALACDVRVAAEGRYRIGLPEATLGLLPGAGGAQRLVRLIGRGRALELLATGRTVTPAEAERLGMVDRLFPAAELEGAVAELAAALAAGAPLAVAAITRLVNDGLERPLVDALDRDLDELGPLLASEDAREGLTAANERRPPSFSGR
jgi:enoyl-CoA hydratase/carnithine racemase